MKTINVILAASAFALAAATAQAAQHGQGQPRMMQQGNTQANGMMGREGMGHGMMLKMMMAMMDTNGDGALSLEEVQAVHARMFGMIDADGDGKATLDEIQSFMQGGGMPAAEAD